MENSDERHILSLPRELRNMIYENCGVPHSILKSTTQPLNDGNGDSAAIEIENVTAILDDALNLDLLCTCRQAHTEYIQSWTAGGMTLNIDARRPCDLALDQLPLHPLFPQAAVQQIDACNFDIWAVTLARTIPQEMAVAYVIAYNAAKLLPGNEQPTLPRSPSQDMIDTMTAMFAQLRTWMPSRAFCYLSVVFVGVERL